MVADNVATQAELDAVGRVRQVVYAERTTVGTTTTTIPNDDTIPQITEGAEFLTVAITPQSAASRLLVEATVHAAAAAATWVVAALFRDSTANAVGASLSYVDSANAGRVLVARAWVLAGSTATTTFRLRAGPSGATTLTVNGSSGTRALGGVPLMTLTVTEVGQ